MENSGSVVCESWAPRSEVVGSGDVMHLLNTLAILSIGLLPARRRDVAAKVKVKMQGFGRAVVWEIRIKQALRKLEIPPDFYAVVQQQGFEV